MAAVALGCSGPAPAPERPDPTPDPGALPDVPVAPPPDGRLPDHVTPTTYRLHMHVDPSRPDFRGRVEIDVEIARPISSFWLHGQDLSIDRAVLEQSGRSLPLARLDAPPDRGLLGFAIGQTIAPGAATLALEFRGEMGTIDGLFRQRHGSAWYAYTDLEPIDARKAFPCFDDPRLKTPWRLTIDAPEGQRVLANSPETDRTAQPSGAVRVTFAPTPPLPSYLVAFAVGPFDLVEGAASGTPIRVIGFPGEAARLRPALAAAEALLPIAEAWVGRRMPFRKLDVVAVPRFDGAMENPGLVTVSNGILAIDRRDPDAERLMTMVIAHEIAHLWFGDLVTMQWWDDLWLNEGWATYLADEWVEAWKPDWDWQLERASLRARAYDRDARGDARAVRQPVTTNAEIRATFDVITYIKGGAVLEMMEGWLGAAAVQKAARRYLDAHAWGSVTTEDLVHALEAASGRSDAGAVLHSFVDQPGVPLLGPGEGCEEGPPRVEKRTRAYRLLGAPAAEQTWHVPLCADHGYYLDAEPDPPASEREVLRALEGFHARVRAGELSPAAAVAAIDRLPTGPIGGPALERLADIAVELASYGAPRPPRLLRASAAALATSRAPSHADRAARPLVIPLAASLGAFKQTRRRNALPDELSKPALVAAAVHGGPQLHDAMTSALEKTTDAAERDALLAGLASFGADPLLQKSLAMTTDRATDRVDAIKLLYMAAENIHTRARTFEFVARNRKALDELHRLNPVMARFACAPDEVALADQLLAAFTPHNDDQRRILEGVEREVRTCERLRAHYRDAQAP